MSVFVCAICDGAYDNYYVEIEEVDGELVCMECYLEWEANQ